ncbi:hypothetical protein [Stenotrophomonas sp. SAU14A_NAIMI4_5]|uniref:hypothetical protein n=1 Tax=Stenotrophomonas sp. SAU14A_NAIMI4_5 TaxID=2072413 RepID=UPI00131F02AB|nr:hypothetical protein [Stenotrophomonas sp. SAU14A_NAIMI4_5]
MTFESIYHGTEESIARHLLMGNMDFALGGGEFGRGFYMGRSLRLARRRAFHKSNHHQGTAREAMALCGNVLRVQLDPLLFRSVYQVRPLTLDQAKALYARLKKSGRCGQYCDGHDALLGPIVGRPQYNTAMQYKFQGERLQNDLNWGGGYVGTFLKAVV